MREGREEGGEGRGGAMRPLSPLYSYRLCELLYEKRRLFGKVLSCYLRDPNRRVRDAVCMHTYTASLHSCYDLALFSYLNSIVPCVSFSSLGSPIPQHQAFSYIHAVMTEDQYTEPDREEVARAMLEKFQVH